MRRLVSSISLGFFAMSTGPEWPNPTFFHIGQKDHLHALGVIIAAFNRLEFVLLLLFKRYLRLEEIPAQKLFLQLRNHTRIELIQEAINRAEGDSAAKEAALHFLDAFETLCEIRNFLAHSQTAQRNEHLTFAKGSKREPETPRFARMKLAEVREIGNHMREFWIFGAALNSYLSSKEGRFSGGDPIQPATLAQKPPLPADLQSILRDTP
jgi:hypothetical protein